MTVSITLGNAITPFGTNVKEAYGAKGDGVTDDSSAIQSGIDAGVALFFPAGTYLISSSLKCKAGGPTVLIGEVPASLQSAPTRIRDSRTTGDEPMLRNPAGWKEFDGNFTDGTNPITDDADLTSINLLYIENLDFSASDSNPEGTCVQFFKGVTSYFKNCRFRGRRGIETGLGSHDNTIINCQASSDFVGDHDWTEPVDGSVLRQNCGFLVTGHSYLYGCTALGCGTGIYTSGNGSNVFGARIEVCGYGMAVGYPRDTPSGAENYPLTRATITGVSMEACWTGLSVETMSEGISIENAVIQGSAPASGRDYTGTVGAEFLSSIGEACSVRNIATRGTFARSAMINFTQVPIENNKPVNSTATSPKVGGMFRPLVRSDNGVEPEIYHFQNTKLFPSATYERHQTMTAFHDLMLPGLTGLNVRDLATSGDAAGGPVFARNLGGTVAVANGETSKAVAFETQTWGGTSVPFNTISAAANVSSTLPADTYYYATTLLARNGEIGINYDDATQNNHRTVVVAEDEEVQMTFADRSTRGIRRIYRGTQPGWFDGYWEIADDSTTFTDDGTTAFDGYAMPPASGALASLEEDDANYEIIAMADYSTNVWVTSKTTTGFTLNFSDPLGDQNISWLLFRP